MSSQPEDGWHGGSGSGDGQAPPARNAAGDAVFPNPMEPIQGAEGVLPATAPVQRTSGAMGPRHRSGSSGSRQRVNCFVARAQAGVLLRRPKFALPGWAEAESRRGAWEQKPAQRAARPRAFSGEGH